MESGHIARLGFEDLDLAATLASGQVFRWVRDREGAWAGAVGRRRMRLSQGADGDLWWEADGPNARQAVCSFLRLVL